MRFPPLTYLTVDSMAEGVGRSQVVAYVERLAARGMEVILHSFEKQAPDEAVARRLGAAGVRWRPHRFREGGSVAGLGRVVQGALCLAGAELVHARSDLAAASALLGRCDTWIWDMRSFWREQRIALGLLSPTSPQARLLRDVEARSARSSSGIVTLSQAAVDELARRHGEELRPKTRVVTTCVDLDRFTTSDLPSSRGLRFLLAGTVNTLYDVPTMARLVDRVRARRPADLTVLTPGPTTWEPLFRSVGATLTSSVAEAMPDHVRQHHLGLSVLRPECGVSSRAATPTKIGEFLAGGRPVVVSGGLGDMDDLLARHDCGVVVTDRSETGLEKAVDEIERLVDDDGTPARCRALAEDHFDIDKGVAALLALYRDVLTSPGLDRPPRSSGRRW